MSSAKSRLNISLFVDIKRILLKITKRDQMPAATKVVRLMEIGLEVEEDEVWDTIALIRDRVGTKLCSHVEVFRS